jgi:ABC-type sugar transport system ATPase subunit
MPIPTIRLEDPTAIFIGTPPMNFVDCRLERDASRSVLRNEHFSLAIQPALATQMESFPDGKELILGIRPEHMHISDSGDGLQVNVSSEDYHGSDTIVRVRPAAAVDQEPAEIKVRVQGRVRLPQGRQLGLFWEREHMQVFGLEHFKTVLCLSHNTLCGRFNTKQFLSLPNTAGFPGLICIF